MVEITAFCSARTAKAVLSKMAARTPLMSRGHPYHGMTVEQLEPVLWDIVEKEIKVHCSKPQTSPLMYNAFIVGAPLNDTVFMCTGAQLNHHEPQRTFVVEHEPIGGNAFIVDFYVLIDGEG